MFIPSIVFISIGLVIILQLNIYLCPFMDTLFETIPTRLGSGIEIIAVSVVMFLIVELEKWLRRSLTKHDKLQP